MNSIVKEVRARVFSKYPKPSVQLMDTIKPLLQNSFGQKYIEPRMSVLESALLRLNSSVPENQQQKNNLATPSKTVAFPPPRYAANVFIGQELSKELELIAENPNTPQNILWFLVSHPNTKIRRAVLDNPTLPPDSHHILAKDIDPDIRYALAENHNVSVDLLTELSNDQNPYVANRAQRTLSRLLIPNPSVTALTLKCINQGISLARKYLGQTKATNTDKDNTPVRFHYGSSAYKGLCGLLWRRNIIKKGGSTEAAQC